MRNVILKGARSKIFATNSKRSRPNSMKTHSRGVFLFFRCRIRSAGRYPKMPAQSIVQYATTMRRKDLKRGDVSPVQESRENKDVAQACVIPRILTKSPDHVRETVGRRRRSAAPCGRARLPKDNLGRASECAPCRRRRGRFPTDQEVVTDEPAQKFGNRRETQSAQPRDLRRLI